MGKTVKMNRNQVKIPSLGCKARKTRLHRYWLFEESLNPFITSKVMFYTCLSVILFTEGRMYPSMHWADTPPRVDTPPPPATAADGAHPTGMHSCSYYFIYSLFLDTLEENQFSQEYNCSIENTNWTKILHRDFQFCFICKGFTQ